MNRHHPSLKIITTALRRTIPGAVPANVTVTVEETLPGRGSQPPGSNSWTGSINDLAQRVFTALYGRLDGGEPVAEAPPAPVQRVHLNTLGMGGAHVATGSTEQYATAPLVAAADAKARRDLGGEVDALMAGERSLEGAPWYPARVGDILHIAYEQAGELSAFGETYVVEPDSESGGALQLRMLAHTSDNAIWAGHFAPGLLDAPLMEPWFEAGPSRLTLIRDGAVVHPLR